MAAESIKQMGIFFFFFVNCPILYNKVLLLTSISFPVFVSEAPKKKKTRQAFSLVLQIKLVGIRGLTGIHIQHIHHKHQVEKETSIE